MCYSDLSISKNHPIYATPSHTLTKLHFTKQRTVMPRVLVMSDTPNFLLSSKSPRNMSCTPTTDWLSKVCDGVLILVLDSFFLILHLLGKWEKEVSETEPGVLVVSPCAKFISEIAESTETTSSKLELPPLCVHTYIYRRLRVSQSARLHTLITNHVKL